MKADQVSVTSRKELEVERGLAVDVERHSLRAQVHGRPLLNRRKTWHQQRLSHRIESESEFDAP